MTMVNIATPMAYPLPSRALGNPSINSVAALTLDAAGEYSSVIFMAYEAMTISHIGFYVQTATDSPTADVRIETVGTDGLPSGTLWATDTNVVTGALSTGFALHALTSPASVTAGQMVCIKIAYVSGTTLALGRLVQCITGASEGLPYAVLNTGTPTKTLLNYNMVWAVGSSTSAFYTFRGIMIPGSSVSVDTYNNTDGNRRGVRFRVPFKCRCVGMLDWNAQSVGDFDVSLYNDAGTLLESVSVDGDHTLASVSATSLPNIFFDTPITLDANTFYRAVKTPTSATNDTISVLTLPSTDYMDGFGWGNGNAHYTTFTTGGGWVDSATDRIPVFMRILIDQVDDGTGSGAAGGVSRARVFGGF